MDPVVEAILSSTPADTPPALGPAAQRASESLSTLRIPTTRAESHRFTDLQPVLNTEATLVAAPAGALSSDLLRQVRTEKALEECAGATVVLADGHWDLASSDLATKKQGGVFLGRLEDAPADIQAQAGVLTSMRGGCLAQLNAATAPDCVVLHVAKGVHVSTPIHIISVSSSSSPSTATMVSAPRVLVVLEEGAEAEVVEEFCCADGKGTHAYVVNAVLEAHLAKASVFHHRYVANEAPTGAHLKTTLVDQAVKSAYHLTEVRVGGTLTRHDVDIEQLGEKTVTNMRHFILCGPRETHDLHSTLVLDHPEGTADQLHKCIAVDGTSRGVFDGNVQVRQKAQGTDAAQLTRNLLLAKGASVYARPNLQIVADDVKCTHGCTVSDLEDEQVFYFLSRGIDAEAARSALVYSFGMEVVGELPYTPLRERLQKVISATLEQKV